MFTTVRYFIKTSIIFLITGILTGLYMSISLNVFNTSYPTGFISAHTHIILVGSVMMMIMGVALWFFPRAIKDDKKYQPDIIWGVYFIMTLATAFRFITEILTSLFNLTSFRGIISFFSLLQVLALILFFYSIWGRIRSSGSHLREAKGEKF